MLGKLRSWGPARSATASRLPSRVATDGPLLSGLPRSTIGHGGGTCPRTMRILPRRCSGEGPAEPPLPVRRLPHASAARLLDGDPRTDGEARGSAARGGALRHLRERRLVRAVANDITLGVTVTKQVIVDRKSGV